MWFLLVTGEISCVVLCLLLLMAAAHLVACSDASVLLLLYMYAQLSWMSNEARLKEECQTMEQHCQELTQQNNLLHSESEKLLAKIFTLTQSIAGEVSHKK